MKTTCIKSYRDLPAAHRQPKHDGHCAQVHGHNWGFDLVFVADALDANGFVVDVGKLKSVKAWLEDHFDHTLLLNEDDPQLKLFSDMERAGLVKVVVVPNCGMEGLAHHVLLELNGLLDQVLMEGNLPNPRHVRVTEVVCWEDSKNRATFSL